MNNREVASFSCELLEAPLAFNLLQERVEDRALGEVRVHSFRMLREEARGDLD